MIAPPSRIPMATMMASIVELEPAAPKSAPASRPSLSVAGMTSPTALTIRLTGVSSRRPRTVSARTTAGMETLTAASHALVRTARGLVSFLDKAMIAPLSRMRRWWASFSTVRDCRRGVPPELGQPRTPCPGAGHVGGHVVVGGEVLPICTKRAPACLPVRGPLQVHAHPS